MDFEYPPTSTLIRDYHPILRKRICVYLIDALVLYRKRELTIPKKDSEISAKYNISTAREAIIPLGRLLMPTQANILSILSSLFNAPIFSKFFLK